MSSINGFEKQATKGVYFLASDGVYDLAVAFLNSFRASNPRIPLCLIPYDQRIERLLKLSSSYQFSIFSDAEILQRCDRISVALHGHRVGQYRKIAAWEGEFDQFVYIDSDTVVLRDISPIFDELPQFDVLTSHSNLPANRKWVWRDSIVGTSVLTEEQIAYSANTGFIVSRKGTLTVEKAEARLDSAILLAPHMELECTEQPFLNYLIVTSVARYSSLAVVCSQQNRQDIPWECWAGEGGGEISGGEIRFPRRPPVLFVHWAGEWQICGWRRRFYKLFCRLCKREQANVRPFMKYKRLWTHYRYLSLPANSYRNRVQP